ncbi:hypothetical protein IE53DRAFT_198134 [Violaceomyces palustris]|uniref:Uncharacterized protein n=1 Tax=Violaceomyces palustris TaxID=1673888 RepID=A0ACD0NRF6_9BASI|nr:hypothetical protein IE53DRAFT_198134 [Violaceomyces palustris]
MYKSGSSFSLSPSLSLPLFPLCLPLARRIHHRTRIQPPSWRGLALLLPLLRHCTRSPNPLISRSSSSSKSILDPAFLDFLHLPCPLIFLNPCSLGVGIASSSGETVRKTLLPRVIERGPVIIGKAAFDSWAQLDQIFLLTQGVTLSLLLFREPPEGFLGPARRLGPVAASYKLNDNLPKFFTNSRPATSRDRSEDEGEVSLSQPA